MEALRGVENVCRWAHDDDGRGITLPRGNTGKAQSDDKSMKTTLLSDRQSGSPSSSHPLFTSLSRSLTITSVSIPTSFFVFFLFLFVC